MCSCTVVVSRSWNEQVRVRKGPEEGDTLVREPQKGDHIGGPCHRVVVCCSANVQGAREGDRVGGVKVVMACVRNHLQCHGESLQCEPTPCATPDVSLNRELQRRKQNNKAKK
jgi:hypothetical protein